ncbi:MAG: hypothetical protein IT247_08370 [Bacteroidia bacterium]|nr:hypothetical protein [Bacteroidia bacterium]
MLKQRFLFFAFTFIFLSKANGQEFYQIWNFDSLNFKGTYNSFQKQPSFASVYLNDSVYSGYGGRSFQLNALKNEEGYCGAWINFFSSEKGKNPYVNASEYKFISLRIKGASGREKLQIQLSDKVMQQQEDSRPCKPLNSYLPEGITTNWQELIIPLTDFNGIDITRLTGITFNFTVEGKYTVFIDDLYLKKEITTSLPVSNIQHPKAGNRALENAMWVWQTYKLFNDLAYRDTLIRTCRQLQVNHVFMQMFYDDNLTELSFADSLRSVIRLCNQHQIKVYALDGSPEWGCYDKHEIPLTIVKLVADFNSRSSASEKLGGVHFDIEPYLLLGFSIPDLRKQIIHENLELKKKLSLLCHTHNLTLGIDIPFWYEDPDSTGVPLTNIEFNHSTKAASFHMIDLADHIAIMGYRNFAYGSDGMINKDIAELEYASGIKGKEIWAGVETLIETPMPYMLFSGIPKERLNHFLSDNAAAIGRKSRFMGYRLLMFEHGNYVHFGLEQSASKKKKEKRRNQPAILEVKNLLASYTDTINKGAPYNSLNAYLANSPKEFQLVRKGKKKDDISLWKVIISPTDAKISFARKSLDEMLIELYKASVVFYDYPSFRGFAFHCYETILDMK